MKVEINFYGDEWSVKDEWILIDEQLPEPGTPVFIAMTDKPHGLIAVYDHRGHWRLSDGIVAVDRVTHWRSLPELP